MSRTLLSVKAVFWDLARACGQEPDTAINASGVSAMLTAQLLRCLNTAYQEAYNSNEWEDAWADGTLTPTSGVLAYAAVGEARKFALWSEDPRAVNNVAYPVRAVTSADGIQVQSELGTVFGFWLPAVAVFTDAASESLLVVASIAPAVVHLARAEYLRSTGQNETSEYYEQKGKEKLEEIYAEEFQRVMRCWWRRSSM